MPNPKKYTSSAEFYDAIYTATKDYYAEATEITQLISKHSKGTALSLLDVACGTGLHLEHFGHDFDNVEGLDLSQAQLDIAKTRLPNVTLHWADMLNFRLDAKFDAITCLFSAIGYTRTQAELEAAVLNMARHILPGGVLVIEPWIFPDAWQDGTPHLQVVETPEFILVRMNRSSSQGNVSVLQMHYLVMRATDAEPEHFFERHLLTMHTKEAYLNAMEAAGLNGRFVPNDRRGYIVGVKH
jgi:SAM-dependent methyltransferase